MDGEGTQLPHRRLHMRLAVDADSLPDACAALHQIADDLLLEGSERVAQWSGRAGADYGISVDVIDPEMDGKRYRAELRVWRAGRG